MMNAIVMMYYHLTCDIFTSDKDHNLYVQTAGQGVEVHLLKSCFVLSL